MQPYITVCTEPIELTKQAAGSEDWVKNDFVLYCILRLLNMTELRHSHLLTHIMF